jgi:pyruvate/2-oxoglutarate dehydrogenase complex dihydrolipoamide acyltransferase (E2) component
MPKRPVEESASRVDFAQRWLRDGLRVIEPAGGVCSLLIEMSACALLIDELKKRGLAMTYAPIVVCAVAKALSRHPKLHRLIGANKQISGGAVDICLSVAGDAVVTPVVIIENAGEKHLVEIWNEIRQKTPIARAEDEKLQSLLRRWGWVLPIGFLRRAILRMLLGQLWYKRRVSGTFQVTILPSLDLVMPLTFNTAGALGMGAVLTRPVVIDERVEPRLAAHFTCAIDHAQWSGVDVLAFLRELKSVIENETAGLGLRDSSRRLFRN